MSPPKRLLDWQPIVNSDSPDVLMFQAGLYEVSRISEWALGPTQRWVANVDPDTLHSWGDRIHLGMYATQAEAMQACEDHMVRTITQRLQR